MMQADIRKSLNQQQCTAAREQVCHIAKAFGNDPDAPAGN